MSLRVLAIDGGRSGCRARLRADGTATQVTGPPVPYLRGDAPDADLDAAIGTTLGDLAGEGVDVVVAGLAGVFERPEVAAPLAARLAARTRAPRVVVTGDLVTSYVGALGAGTDTAQLPPGVVVAAGTGAVAFAVAADGGTARADGWGFLLGDEGSGFWIGRCGLAAALAHRDGRGGSAPLREAAEARFGPVATVPGLVHGADTPTEVVASFARDVARVAEAGDDTARGIWAQAGRHLASSVAAAAGVHRGDAVPASFTGGLFSAGELLLGPFRAALAELAPQLTVTPSRGSALDGAEALARVEHLPGGSGHVLTGGA